jgi:hypothetical protein
VTIEFDALYASTQPDLEAVSGPLFDFSALCLKKRGNFLPHGALLKKDGQLVLVSAAPNGADGHSTSVEVLPLLHEGLRRRARELGARAIGVAENVTATREGQAPATAIKVLFEHENGLTVALYLPFKKRFLRAPELGEIFAASAEAEVRAWASIAA